MNKARQTILRLVADGQISVEEAEELLDAIEQGSRNPFTDLFSSKQTGAGARARASTPRARARRPERSKQPNYGYDYESNFPWDQPDWRWPWDQPNWQWPWDQPDWQWPWEKKGAESTSVIEVPEEAQLKIRNGGGDLTIRGTSETSLRLTSPRPASRVATEGKVIHVSSAGVHVVMEVPAKVVSVEVAQTGGDVSVEKLKAALVARVAGGDMSISSATGKIQASVEGGDVSLTDISSTEMEVRANAGDISLSMLPTVKEGSISLSADSGDISLLLPHDSQCQVSANAPGGAVSHTFNAGSVEIIDETDTTLNAKLNGGGADFVLAAKMGDIIIKSASIKT